MNKIPVAPYEVASNFRTKREGDFLYLDGKKYRCPTLSPGEVLDMLADIRAKLNICDNTCKGFTRLKHVVFRNVGHVRY